MTLPRAYEILTIDSTELVQIARDRITRGFTDQECEFYRLDPCPTLEELREAA